MAPGALGAGPAGNPGSDRPSPIGPLMAAAARASPGANRGPPNPRVFGAAATEYFKLYGGGVEHLAKIGEPPLFFFQFNVASLCVLIVCALLSVEEP
jgi:hypothetical protein